MPATPRGIAKRKDARAEVTQGLLADAVIATVAEVGVSKLTHRKVAAASGASLSATTYHYKTKGDMLADAANRLLDSYIRDFRSLARDCRQGARPPFTMAELCLRIVRNAAGRNRTAALAWCEIMLDAARSPDGHDMARRWFADVHDAWADVAEAVGERTTALELTAMIDLVVGLLFVSRGLGLDEAALDAVEGGASPAAAWALETAPAGRAPAADRPTSRKSAGTRRRLVAAATELLIEGGTGAVGYAGVAERTGDAMTAPAYHFGSIRGLLKAAESAIFQASKARARAVFASGPSTCRTPDDLADVTARIFIREATRFRLETVALYSIWLEAARDPHLRPDISAVVDDQLKAWTRRLGSIDGGREHNALVCQATFVGALIRVVATDAQTAELVAMRAEFLWMFRLATTRRENSTLFQNVLAPGAIAV